VVKAYVMLVGLGAEDPNGNPIPVKRGRVIFDAEINVTGVSAKLTTTNALYKAPNDITAGSPYARYMWIVKAVDGAFKAVAEEDPNASTGQGFRLMTGDVEEFVAEEAGETLALVTI